MLEMLLCLFVSAQISNVERICTDYDVRVRLHMYKLITMHLYVILTRIYMDAPSL